MKAKHLLIFLLIGMISQGTWAQYKMDWKNAPANPIPIAYTKEELNFKGDIKSEIVSGDWGYEYHFNTQGKLTQFKSALIGTTDYLYDASGRLTKSVSKSSYGDITELYTLDSQNRVIQWQYSDGSAGDKYSYNSKGLWDTTRDVITGEITSKKYYDAKNRIIKDEIFNNGAMTYLYEYTYYNSGNYLVVTKKTTTISDGKVSSYTDYYLDGVNLFSSSNLTLNYDAKGNWFQKMNGSSVFSTRQLTYYSGGSSGNNSSIVPSTPNAPNTPNTPSVTDNCESGDCQNGWGKKNFSHGYYEGFWKNGKRHGYGFFRWTDAGDYIGFWDNDQLHGYGCYLGTKKNMIGEYREGMMNGAGYTHDLENEKWEYAIYKNYLVDTAYTFYDNNIETGCVAGDCQDKYGRYKWSNGDVFTGFFRNGKMYMGTYKFASGDKYEGMFNTNNQFHGQGRFFFKDNSYYGGEWVNGQQQGKGYFHDSSYSKKIGEWSNGQLIKSYQ